MTRFKTVTHSLRGWSKWICPTPESYLIKCCGCGLVHEFQFKAFAEGRRKGGGFEIIPLPWPVRAMYRVRRRGK